MRDCKSSRRSFRRARLFNLTYEGHGSRKNSPETGWVSTGVWERGCRLRPRHRKPPSAVFTPTNCSEGCRLGCTSGLEAKQSFGRQNDTMGRCSVRDAYTIARLLADIRQHISTHVGLYRRRRQSQTACLQRQVAKRPCRAPTLPYAAPGSRRPRNSEHCGKRVGRSR